MKKIFLLIDTIRYMKMIQIYYQIWYRFKKTFISIDRYSLYDNDEIHFINSSIGEKLILSKEKYINKNEFEFLNLKHSFNSNIDWNYAGHGKLWNYNLQYFDFLLDETIEVSERVLLLEDFSAKLLNKEIQLEPYPVSLRIINSILFISKHQVNNLLIEKGIKRQIDYLENNLEFHILANHLLENILTLYISSYFIKNKKLNVKSIGLLNKQLKEQILSDGAHYECSPMYHSIILSKLFICIDITDNNQTILSNSTILLRKYASQMLSWINEYSFPDGSWALMNDAALGVAPSTLQINNASNSLSIISEKIQLNDSGYRKLKSSNWELLADFGNIIPPYQPGHAHSDMLSYCIWHKGKQVVVDSGISTYNATSRRQYERSTNAHNTIYINNKSQSDVWSSFRVGKRAKCFISNESESNIEGYHTGYTKNGIIHNRKFLTANDQLIIVDSLKISEGKSSNISSNIISNINLAPSTFVSLNINVIFTSFGSITSEGIIKVKDNQIAESFNNIVKNDLLEISQGLNNTIVYTFQ